MDVGKFKASRKRLSAWIVLAPIIALSIGLSTYGWQQRMQLSLEETQALSDVLPDIIETRRDANLLFESLGASGKGSGNSEDRLLSLLQDVSIKQEFIIESTQLKRMEKKTGSGFPTLRVIVEGSGDFQAVQLFINDIKLSQKLLSVETIDLSLPRQADDDENFQTTIIFHLLLIDEVLQSGGTP